MATMKDMKKDYCDEVFTELSAIKGRIMKMQDNLKNNYKLEGELAGKFERHLCELADQIDWKLQILSHACPYDWKGSDAPEYADNTVSVGPADIQIPEFSGGYVGG